MGLHVAGPLTGLAANGRIDLVLGLLIPYLGYLLFAMVLHKEFFPEDVRIAHRLVLGPAAGAVLLWLVIRLGLPVLFSLYGLLLFASLYVAVMFVLAAGTHLAVADDQKAPGEGGLTWRAEGHSFWSDPAYSPMMRWSVTLVFFVSGAAGIVAWHAVLVEVVLMFGLWSLAWWLIALAACAYGYVYQFAGLTAGGRFFGPGRRSFE